MQNPHSVLLIYHCNNLKGTQPKKAGGSSKGVSTSVSSSKGFNNTNTSVQTKVAGVAIAISEDIYSEHQGNLQINDLPIFQLLKAFKLQQYALKLAELGYGEDIYKLALLNDKQRQDLVIQLKVLPGHNAKLGSFYHVIDELYPKKYVAEQIKQFTPSTRAGVNQKSKMITSATRFRGTMYQQQGKSLIQQYDALDPLTKQAFNETFLINLENAKIGQLMQQHVNREESKQAMNNLFPPISFGYGNKAKQEDANYNKEIEGLLNKYSGNYKNYSSKESLQKKVTYDQARDLQQEMAQALKDIEKINKELEVYSRAQSKPATAISQQRASAEETQERPNTNQNTSKPQQLQQEEIKEVEDVSFFTQTKINDNDDDIPDESQIIISESVIEEAMNILNDPLALSLAVKEQYQQAQVQSNKPQAAVQVQPDDTSFLNPLQNADDSKLNVTTKYYEKQIIFKEPIVEQKRPLSPLIDKKERDRLWNIGQSLDSKQVTSALGYLDLKQICYCLAHALMKHIDFAKGFYFLDDLQSHLRESSQFQQIKGKELEFTYNLGNDLKIDIEKAKQRRLEKEQQSKKEFEELKKKMEYEKQAQITNKISLDKSQQLSNIKQLEEQAVEEEVEEVKDEMDETDYIKDYYEDVSDKNQQADFGTPQQNDEDDLADEDIDFDYSQTHLEDFLKSQNHNTLIKNSNIQSTQLLNTFLSSYSKMKSGTGTSFRDTQLPVGNKYTSQNMNPIAEGIEERESEKSETKTKKEESEDEEDDEELGRSAEHIDLNKVEVTSKGSPAKQSKPILSKEEVKKIQEDQQKQNQPQNIQIDVKTKAGFKDLMRFQLRIFDQNYDFNKDELVGGESMYLGNPTIEELYYYCKYVIISGRMEKEIPILCLVYLERFFTKTGVLMNHANWKRLTLISLLLASKIWDDDSLENVHFPQVLPDITLKEITSLEKVFLQLIEFDLIIRGAEYAKYYFVLKTFAENFNSTLPMGPLSVEQMSGLQNNTVKAESDLREKYQTKVSLKKTMQINWFLQC